MLAAAVAVLCLVQQTSGDGYDPASDHVASRCASRCAFGWGFALPTLPRAQCAQLRMEGQPGASGAEAEMSRRRKKVLLRVRIKIMEDVVRRVNDPALSYHRKRETVDELEGYLHRMRALTADSGTDADADTLALTPPLERAVQPRTPAPDTQQQLREIEIAQVLARMRNAKVIAVLRGKNKQRLVDRGLELAQLGCRCMEVTLDSPEALCVVRELRQQLPRSVLLGAATAMGAAQAAEAISAGAMFITSPIAAVDIIGVCHEAGVLAIPAGLTPTEIYTNIAAGARAVKAFPASVLTPDGLKGILQLGPFQDTFVMAAGGVVPQDVPAWLQAGADAVALGTQLVGSDVRLGTSPYRLGAGGGREASELEWEERGRQEARALFDSLMP